MFACEYCKHEFAQKRYMKRHTAYCAKHPADFQPPKPKCPRCDKVFSRADAVNRHITKCQPTLKQEAGKKRIHNSGGGPPPKKQRCETCNVDVASLHNHLKSSIHKQKLSSMYDGKTEIITSSFKNRIISYRLFSSGKHLTPGDFMEDVRQRVINLIRGKISEVKSAFKVNLELFGLYCKWVKDGDGEKEEEELKEIKSFNTKNRVIPVYSDDIMNEMYSCFIDEIIAKADEFQERDSGWALAEIIHLEVNINKYTPLKGSSYIPLPAWIQVKHACVNVKNNDNACFAWAIVSALYPATSNSNRITSYPYYDKVLNLDGISFPMSLSDIKRFEMQNNISINVFEISKKIITGPIYHTQHRQKHHINLLLVEDGEKRHYCWIKNLSRLVSAQVSAHHHQMWFCDGCLLSFTNEIKFSEHIKHDCARIKTIIPNEGDNILKFKQFL